MYVPKLKYEHILLLERNDDVALDIMHCFVKIKAEVRAYSVSTAIDKISLRILINSYKTR